MKIKVNKQYKHFKGKIVTVLALAKHSETLEDMVVYEHDGDIWVRPYELFVSKVDKESIQMFNKNIDLKKWYDDWGSYWYCS